MTAKRVLILVENLPSPFDRRVWQEAVALRDAGYAVSIICPTGRGFEAKFEALVDIPNWRFDLPMAGARAKRYLLEHATGLLLTFPPAARVLFGLGIDVGHACNTTE